MQFRPYNLSTWIFFQIGNLIGSFFKRRQLSTQPRTCAQIRHDANGHNDDCPYTYQEYENLMSWGIDPEEHWRSQRRSLPPPPNGLPIYRFPVPTAPMFVGSIWEGVYHHPDCDWAEKISPWNRRVFRTGQDAVRAQFRPCKLCWPDRVH
jgi:hypothetical protein